MRRFITPITLLGMLLAVGVTPSSTRASMPVEEGALYLNHWNGDGTANCGGGCSTGRPLCYCCGC
jgi:hypothetical protein